MKIKRIAYSRVILPNGDTLRNEVIEFDANQNVINHFPLTEELPFVEWHNETFEIKKRQ